MSVQLTNYNNWLRMILYPYRWLYRTLFAILFYCLTPNFTYAQAPFVPTQLAGLQIWLAADSGTVPSGGNIQQWQDLSGNNVSVTQNTTVNQPQLISNALNNKPALHFGKNGSGGDETYFSFPQVSLNPGNFTIVCFYKTSAATNPVHFILGGSGQGVSSGGTSFPGLVIFDGSNLLQSTGTYNSYSLSSFTNSTIYRNGSQLTTTGTPVGTMTLNSVGARPDFLPGFF